MVKRAILINFSVSLASFALCAFLIEAACRLFFDAPPSVVIENLSNMEKAADLPKDSKRVTIEDGKIVSRDFPDWGFYFHTPTGRRLRRGVSGVVRPHRLSKIEVEITTNSLGYRYDEIGDKTDRDYRILALGDSITLADFVAVDQAYPAVVERILNETPPPNFENQNIQVINAGVGAIDLQNELAILMETGLSVEPDVVLVGLYLNDAYHSPVLEVRKLPSMISWSHFVRLASWRLDVLRDQYVYEESDPWDKETTERAGKEYLAEFSLVKDDPHKTHNWRKSQEAFHRMIARRIRDWGYAWTDDYWRKVMPTLEIMKQVSRDEGFRLAVFLFPVRLQVQSEFLMDKPQRNFELHMKELGVAHFDLLPTLREKFLRDGENLFYDHCHYRPEGYEYVASAVAQFLIRDVISR
jgi:lysophospholipase L1-like esterase